MSEETPANWTTLRQRVYYGTNGSSRRLILPIRYGHNGLVAYQPRSSTHTRLVKQTYSVFVETNRGQRKWHMSKFNIIATDRRL